VVFGSSILANRLDSFHAAVFAGVAFAGEDLLSVLRKKAEIELAVLAFEYFKFHGRIFLLV
jgi:hypothetical protein